MAETQLDRKFFASTRGQLVSLLRFGPRTVEELATTLRVTDNAVRAHLAALERDGLVEQEGARRGGGKPSYLYHLTPEAERLFPKPYSLVLNELLEVLRARLNGGTLEEILGEAGRNIGARRPHPGGSDKEKLEAGTALLNELGGLAVLEEKEGRLAIRGYSCPLSAIVPGHPEACHLAQTLLAEYTGLPVEEQCERGADGEIGRGCYFFLPLPPQ